MFGNFIRQQHNKVGALFICLGAAGAGYSGYLYFTLPHTLPVVAGLFVTTALSGMTGLAGFSTTGNRILPDWLRRAPENAVALPIEHAHDPQLAQQQAPQQQANIQIPMQAQVNPAPRPLVLHHEQPQAQELQEPIVPAPQPAQLHHDEPARPQAPAAKKAPARRMDRGISR